MFLFSQKPNDAKVNLFHNNVWKGGLECPSCPLSSKDQSTTQPQQNVIIWSFQANVTSEVISWQGKQLCKKNKVSSWICRSVCS